MHRLSLLCKSQRRRFLAFPRYFSSPSPSPSPSQQSSSILHPKDLKILQNAPPPSNLPNQTLLPLSPSPRYKFLSFFALSAALISFAAFHSSDTDPFDEEKSQTLLANLERSLEKSNEYFHRVFDRMKQTGIAAAVLWKSLRSVLSSANQEVRLGFELRVASLLADIVAASESRRSAIVSAGGGAVVDWLLDTVSSTREPGGTQAESARALAYLIADPSVCGAVLGRPHAVPNLLRFIFSFQPKRAKQVKRSSPDSSDVWKGRSMLVAAIMDIVTSNCDSIERTSFQPALPGDADTGDIQAALQVIEEGGMQLDEPLENDDEDGDKGMKGIGIKILGGTTVLSFSRINGLLKVEHSDRPPRPSAKPVPKTLLLHKNQFSSQAERTVTVPGLWDDLHGEHVAVPFAAWALANWAMASDANRFLIQELDRDGQAVMTALMAPERTVKWHGSIVARLLLEDQNLPLSDSVPDWSSSLISTISQACKVEDIALAQMALSAFLIAIERSAAAQIVVMQKGLPLMRQIAKQTQKQRHVQEALAKALEILSTRNMHLSLEESQKWAGILLHWVCGKLSSDSTRFSATKILSCILEDYGPSAITISQGWLTILLTEIPRLSKAAASKGDTQLDRDKIQIDQSNALSASQTAKQLAIAVVNLAGKQLGTTVDSVDEFPLVDLFSLDPFADIFRNLKKDNLPKIDAADSASATLKGIKALTEICAEDSAWQEKIADFGVLCLLRRFLLCDDYEQLAAIETYDASRILETQDCASYSPGGTSVADGNDPSVRVPPSAHIRRHAARLLTILSLLPKVQKTVLADEVWCKWLEDCANGKIAGCNDLKIQKSVVPPLDIVFVHGLRGGPFKTWRIADSKSSTTSKSGLVENIDQEAGKQGTCWPREWLAADFPHARLFAVKYKTNLTRWSGASLPLQPVSFLENAQEVSSNLLKKLVAAGIGDRPVVFVTHSMGGLVVKQMLHQAKMKNFNKILNNTIGVVFYSCPHFGSKLADMPWRMGFVFRPAPSIGELRSGSGKLEELNDFIRHLQNKGMLEVLSFSETLVTPIVEGYGGWALRMEIVPIESAYPGFGELVVLEATDHINSCKPINRTDPSYAETLAFLQKLKANYT
ncbi:hypothetical protein ACLOJK_016483 [Asimina triloba]